VRERLSVLGVMERICGGGERMVTEKRSGRNDRVRRVAGAEGGPRPCHAAKEDEEKGGRSITTLITTA
jgi:hypothetical protein